MRHPALTFAMIAVAAVVFFASQPVSKEEQALAAERAAEARRGLHCLSVWDGTHREVTAHVRDRLWAPLSLEPLDTRVSPIGPDGTHDLLMRYAAVDRGGRPIRGYAVARFDNRSCAASDIRILDS